MYTGIGPCLLNVTPHEMQKFTLVGGSFLFFLILLFRNLCSAP